MINIPTTASHEMEDNEALEYLFSAIRDNDIETAKALYDMHKNLNIASNEVGMTSLMLTCEVGDEDMLDFILSKQPNLNAIYNGTAITRAINNKEYGDVFLQMLIDHRPSTIDVSIKDIYTGRNALMESLVLAGCRYKSRLLMELPWNIEDKDKYGNTALLLAVQSIDNYYVVMQLLEKGANKDIKNREGKTAMDLAVAPCKLLLMNSDDAVKIFLSSPEAKIDANIRMKHTMNRILRKRIISGDAKALTNLISSPYFSLQDNLNFIRAPKRGPVIFDCIKMGHVGLLKWMIEEKANVDVSNSNSTVLMHAINHQNAVSKYVLKILLTHLHSSKCDASILTYRQTSLMSVFYVLAEHEELVSFLRLFLDIFAGRGVVSISQNNLNHALRLAIIKNAKINAELLIEFHADVNHRYQISRQTYLMELCKSSLSSVKLKLPMPTDAIELLLHLKANVNLQDKHGNTVLMIIMSSPHGWNISDRKVKRDRKQWLIEKLLNYGAKVDIQNHDGKTVIDIARNDSECSLEIRELLKKFTKISSSLSSSSSYNRSNNNNNNSSNNNAKRYRKIDDGNSNNNNNSTKLNINTTSTYNNSNNNSNNNNSNNTTTTTNTKENRPKLVAKRKLTTTNNNDTSTKRKLTTTNNNDTSTNNMKSKRPKPVIAKRKLTNQTEPEETKNIEIKRIEPKIFKSSASGEIEIKRIGPKIPNKINKIPQYPATMMVKKRKRNDNTKLSSSNLIIKDDDHHKPSKNEIIIAAKRRLDEENQNKRKKNNNHYNTTENKESAYEKELIRIYANTNMSKKSKQKAASSYRKSKNIDIHSDLNMKRFHDKILKDLQNKRDYHHHSYHSHYDRRNHNR